MLCLVFYYEIKYKFNGAKNKSTKNYRIKKKNEHKYIN